MSPLTRRGKRLTIGVMVVGLAVVIIFAIAHWSTVRDHAEAWHFQLTRETKAIAPNPALRGSTRPLVVIEDDHFSFALDDCLLALATWSGQSIVLDSAEDYVVGVVC